MVNVQNYILAQWVENTVKRKRITTWTSGWGFFRSENREIEDITADELNILICRFMMDTKKADGGAYEATTLASFASCLHSREKKCYSPTYGLKYRYSRPTGTVSSKTDLPDPWIGDLFLNQILNCSCNTLFFVKFRLINFFNCIL